jgi:hypothetical protein
MTEANKKSVRDVLIIFGSFGLYALFAHVVPDGSIAKKIMGGLMVAALIASAIWFTAIGNPLKRWLRNRKSSK